jgi:hypothetical protein
MRKLTTITNEPSPIHSTKQTNKHINMNMARKNFRNMMIKEYLSWLEFIHHKSFNKFRFTNSWITQKDDLRHGTRWVQTYTTKLKTEKNTFRSGSPRSSSGEICLCGSFDSDIGAFAVFFCVFLGAQSLLWSYLKESNVIKEGFFHSLAFKRRCTCIKLLQKLFHLKVQFHKHKKHLFDVITSTFENRPVSKNKWKEKNKK